MYTGQSAINYDICRGDRMVLFYDGLVMLHLTSNLTEAKVGV